MKKAAFQDLTPGYDAVRRRAGLVDRPDRVTVIVTGADRAGWLQGLLSNDVAALAERQGCYATYLTPQGRMLADVHVLNLGSAMLLDLPAIAKTPVIARLDQFIITEDVEIADASDRIARVGVHGPDAARVVSATLATRAGSADAPALVGSLASLREDDAIVLGEMAHAGRASTFALGAGGAIVIGNRDCGASGFDVLVPVAREAAVRAALREQGAEPVSAIAWNTLRIEAGRPLFGIDMDDETIPLEAGLEDRAISFTKGCYVGQEVIVRVRDRGHGRVARKLVGLVSIGDDQGTGSIASAGDLVRAEARDVGRVTSAEFSPALGRTIALGYVHRDFVDAGVRVEVVHQDREWPMLVAALPFVAGGGEEGSR